MVHQTDKSPRLNYIRYTFFNGDIWQLFLHLVFSSFNLSKIHHGIRRKFGEMSFRLLKHRWNRLEKNELNSDQISLNMFTISKQLLSRSRVITEKSVKSGNNFVEECPSKKKIVNTFEVNGGYLGHPLFLDQTKFG